MYRVTTPTHTFTLPIQTSTCKEVEVTYKQNDHVERFHYQDQTLPEGMTLDGKNVIIHFTQEQTKRFLPIYPIAAQVRVLTNDDEVFASQMFTLYIDDVLSERILADDES